MRWFLVGVSVVISLAFVSAAEAASATLSSPSDGAVYYTGNDGTCCINAQVTLSATVDNTGCTGDGLWYIFRKKDTDADFRSYDAGGGVNQDPSLNATKGIVPGVWNIKASGSCPGGGEFSSSVVTITVIHDNPPPPPGALTPELAAICADWRGKVAEMGEKVKEIDKIAEDEEQMSTAFWAAAKGMDGSAKLVAANIEVAEVAEPAALGLEVAAFTTDQFANATDVHIAVLKVSAFQARDDYDAARADVAADCPGYELPAIEVKPKYPTTQAIDLGYGVLEHIFLRPVAAHSSAQRGPPAARAATDELRDTAKQLVKASKHLAHAQTTLNSHTGAPSLTPDGGISVPRPPDADVAAVRKAASAMIALVRKQGTQRRALATDLEHLGAKVARTKFQAANFPKALRGTAAVKSLVGLSILKLLGPEMSRLDKGLIEALGRQPILMSQ